MVTLLKAGAGIDVQNTLEGRTALLWAAHEGANPTGMIMVLLKAGADAKVKDKEGMIALDYAQSNYLLKGTEVLKQLEEVSQ